MNKSLIQFKVILKGFPIGVTSAEVALNCPEQYS